MASSSDRLGRRQEENDNIVDISQETILDFLQGVKNLIVDQRFTDLADEIVTATVSTINKLLNKLPTQVSRGEDWLIAQKRDLVSELDKCLLILQDRVAVLENKPPQRDQKDDVDVQKKPLSQCVGDARNHRRSEIFFMFSAVFTPQRKRHIIKNDAFVDILTAIHRGLIEDMHAIEKAIEAANKVEEIEQKGNGQAEVQQPQEIYKKSPEQRASEQELLLKQQAALREVQDSFVMLVNQAKVTDCSDLNSTSDEMEKLKVFMGNFNDTIKKSVSKSLTFGQRFVKALVKLIAFLTFFGCTSLGATIGTIAAPGAGTVSGAIVAGALSGGALGGALSYGLYTGVERAYSDGNLSYLPCAQHIHKATSAFISRGWLGGRTVKMLSPDECSSVAFSISGRSALK